MKMDNKYAKLPKIFKKRWIKALKSGNYKQGEGSLYDKDDETYCCLGVAEAICGTPKNKMHLKGFPDNLKTPLSPKILSIGQNAVTDKLSTMNDGGRKRNLSFKQIANWIERNL